jgi:hypothetical protein
MNVVILLLAIAKTFGDEIVFTLTDWKIGNIKIKDLNKRLWNIIVEHSEDGFNLTINQMNNYDHVMFGNAIRIVVEQTETDSDYKETILDVLRNVFNECGVAEPEPEIIKFRVLGERYYYEKKCVKCNRYYYSNEITKDAFDNVANNENITVEHINHDWKAVIMSTCDNCN